MNLKSLIDEFRESGTETRMKRDDAVRDDVIRPILARLLTTDQQAFDAMMWLIWWVEFKDQGCEWRSSEIGRLLQAQHIARQAK
jgi:hypothetical protein